MRLLRDGDRALEAEISDVVYADDLAVCAAVQDAMELVKATSHVAANVLNTLYGFGLRPNLGPSKTAAVLAPLGRGAKTVRHDIYTLRKSRVPVLLENMASVFLDIVPSYQHLGARVNYAAEMGDEVVHRINIAKAVFREGRKRVYCCRAVGLDRRLLLFRGHVLSTLLHGAGAWTRLREQTFNKLSGALHSMLRQMLLIGYGEDQHWTVAQILSGTNSPPMRCLLHIERLRFAGMMFRAAPDIVWALARADDQYLQCVWNAFDWLYERVAHTVSLPCPRRDADRIDAWLEFSRASPGRWKGILKRAAELELRHQHVVAYSELCIKDVWPDAVQVTPGEGRVHEHVCLPCRRAFATYQMWGSHASCKHRYRAVHMRYAKGRQCQSCWNVYANNARLGRHLQAVPSCLERVRGLAFVGRLDSLLEGVAPSQAPAFRGKADAVFEPVPTVPGEVFQSILQLPLDDPACLERHVRLLVEPFPAIVAALEELGTDPQHRPVALAVRDSIVADAHGMVEQIRSRVSEQGQHVPLITLLPDCDALASGEVMTFGTPNSTWARMFSLNPATFCTCKSLKELGEAACEAGFLWCSFPAPPIQSSCVWEPGSATLRQSRRHQDWCFQVLRLWTQAIKAAYRGTIVGLGFDGVSAAGLGWLFDFSLQAGGGLLREGHPLPFVFCFTNLAA